MPLIQFTQNGMYCPQGDFYIDPWKPVKKAVITHAHADHARPGNSYYLAQKLSIPILKLRLGENQFQSLDWKEQIDINGVKLSFYPAGHIIGSAQVRLEYGGEVWVIAGDYKVTDDGISKPFEPVKCDVFITESTFGLPVYHWKPQQMIFDNMLNWVAENKSRGKASVIIAYSLGKAQRVIEALRPLQEKIYAHGAVYNVQQTFIDEGLPLLPVERITPETSKNDLKEAVIVAPPGAEGSTWMRRFEPYAFAICSGWMQVRGNVRRRNADAGFVLSDHADWEGLIAAVKASGASKVFVTHGFQSVFSRYLNDLGIESAEVKTEFGEEEPSINENEIF